MEEKDLVFLVDFNGQRLRRRFMGGKVFANFKQKIAGFKYSMITWRD
jgi:K+-sensing histidine kinase KdpD